MFKIDIEKAKELHRHRIRIARSGLFKSLDFEFMKAVEDGDNEKIKEIKEKKQILRDLPSCDEICNACCIDDLRNYWPEDLCCDSPYDGNGNIVGTYPDNYNPNLSVDNFYNQNVRNIQRTQQ